jgi:hypothetical protein
MLPLGLAKHSIVLLNWIFNGSVQIWPTDGTAETAFKLIPYQLIDLSHFEYCAIKTGEI